MTRKVHHKNLVIYVFKNRTFPAQVPIFTSFAKLGNELNLILGFRFMQPFFLPPVSDSKQKVNVPVLSQTSLRSPLIPLLLNAILEPARSSHSEAGLFPVLLGACVLTSFEALGKRSLPLYLVTVQLLVNHLKFAFSLPLFDFAQILQLLQLQKLYDSVH